MPARRLGVWGATAMVVAETIGVGIFLTPATLVRTLGSAERVLALWVVMGALTVSGALCYAELSTRFPRAGGMYVYLREAFGWRCAFVYGWMALLVMDPGITAALAIGGAQYLLASTGWSTSTLVPVAMTLVVMFGLFTLAGLRVSGQLLRWTAFAKLAGIAVVLIAAVAYTPDLGDAGSVPLPPLGMASLAPAVITAFFAFGGWWDLGRLSEDVDSPRRTMPRALLIGVTTVTIAYAMVSMSLILGAPAGLVVSSDAALVDTVSRMMFGATGSRLLTVIVVVAVGGSLAAVLLGAPRLYLAMAHDGLFPRALLRHDVDRGTLTGATIIQVTLACVLVSLGTFDQILGYFVPGAVFFLGLSAGATLLLPRPPLEAPVFRSPLHPLPTLLFLTLVAVMLALFLIGQPYETAIGAGAIALGVPASLLVRRGAA